MVWSNNCKFYLENQLGYKMVHKKTENIRNKISITKLKSKSLHNVEKKLLKKDKKSLNNNEKYLSPVFSTMSGATYSFENC